MTKVPHYKTASPQQRDSEPRLIQPSEKSETHQCPRCGTAVYCGFSAGEKSCWCFDTENRIPLPTNAENKLCLCRQCLINSAHR